MNLYDFGEKLSENKIARFEKELNISLPDDYKSFMLENNGGTPEEDLAFDFFDISTNTNNNSIINYFGVIYEKSTMEDDDLKSGYIALVESDQIPKTFLPIAEDPGGNIIFMCIGKENYGKIYFGDNELEDPLTGFLVMSVIANSFSEFIDKLYVYEDE